jgi:hypothetical protein
VDPECLLDAHLLIEREADEEGDRALSASAGVAREREGRGFTMFAMDGW